MISIRRKKGLVSVRESSKHYLFQFSQKLDYGLFLLTELSRQGKNGPLSLRTIADQNRMSFFFLQKIAYELRRAGFIEASRGKNGGYVLVKPAKKLCLKEVFEALEGPIAVMPCLANEPGQMAHQNCVRESWCTMKSGFNALNQLLIDFLTKTTLSNLLTK
jgi:Rrf2 family cysteine metabolism transcriptional repressor